MKLPALLVSDTHFTANPRDDYRWKLWPWLREQCALYNVQTLLHLGDLTDAKDNHPSELVNRLVWEIKETSVAVDRVMLNMGNHDFQRDGHMFFDFLNVIPRVSVVTRPKETDIGDVPCLMLPYTKTPGKDWQGMDLSHYSYVFCHQTYAGSRASNGQCMEGDGDMSVLKGAWKVYSGDIHVPQSIGPVEYVGSPFQVTFGDNFKPRCVLLDAEQRATDLHFRAPRRLSLKIRDVKELLAFKFRRGDHVRVTLELSEAEKHEWRALRRQCLDIIAAEKCVAHGVELVVKKSRRRLMDARAQATRRVLTPDAALLQFATSEDLGAELYDAGAELLS